jgi:hypothetical protein
MKTPRTMLVVVGLVSGAAALLPASAQATQKFPSAIYNYLGTSFTVKPYLPPCSLCHSRGSTGPGTAQTPFALSAKARGLVPSDTPSMNAALAAMDTDEVDSDGDGVPDIQELRDGTDPNTPGDVSLVSESGPNAGCGGNTKPRSSRLAGVPGIGLSLLPLLRRARRRK